ncbi:RND transporter [Reichenbachiella sp. 5M10]|uniref:TolC family protein n=1 Tax=Reichenbachiella sp. 5M10 TaxID=1889772 RepID=UPI000C14E73D|nr:TolC family protein [Reichenbachiella sp. 5M10]PIB35045.1 RND transporter [Reichenbachiella sp. 5M10]
MIKSIINKCLVASILAACVWSCAPDLTTTKTENTDSLPDTFTGSQDSTNTAQVTWQEYFGDPYLTALIDTALHNNQELNIMLQEIEIARFEVRAKKGEYLPSVSIGAGGGVEKVGRYTPQGASEATTDIKPGKAMPDPVPDIGLGAYATWEIDIWKKLRNAKKAAVKRYLASIDGKNFMVTNLISDIASAYYELLALDNELAIVQQNIEIQTNALEIVKQQQLASRITSLPVRKFEAEVLSTKSLQYGIQQQIIEKENEINYLVGRYPQPIERNAEVFKDLVPGLIYAGIPAQMLANRPDIRQAELELEAAKLDIKVAKARFYPSVGITAGIGFQAFNPKYLIKSPESLLYSLAGDISAPLINRNAIKATYFSANAKQIQAVYNYEQAILKGYIDVINQLSNISNLEQSYSLKEQEVEALNQSIVIANDLFKSARADYMEVLMTQRDALHSRFELVETKIQQLNAKVNIYQALGGGWTYEDVTTE